MRCMGELLDCRMLVGSFKNFDEAYVKLYPVFNWKPVKLFQVGDDMGKLG